MRPPGFSDQQLAQIMSAAASLPSGLRNAFMSRISNSISGRPIDDAMLHAAIMGAIKALHPRRRGDTGPAFFPNPRRRQRM